MEIQNKITNAIMDVVTKVPTSSLKKVGNPEEEAMKLIKVASWKSAGTSGLMAMAPGPYGIATILPDLYGIWKIQSQLVADIAALFGKTTNLTPETMIFCLFKHGGAHMFNDFIIRVGERVIIKRASLRVIQSVAEKMGLRVTQKLIGSAVSRYLPLIGATAIGAYAKYDTNNVGMNALELFRKDLEGNRYEAA